MGGIGVDTAASHKLRTVIRALWVVALVAIVSFVDFALVHANSSTAAFTFLLVILCLATWVGATEAITASLASMLAYNLFFLPPIGNLRISDPQNWVALIAFLATAISASTLSMSVRRRAEEAEARRNELQRLYQFSQSVLLVEDEQELLESAARNIRALFGVESVCIFESGSGTASGECSQQILHFLKNVADADADARDQAGDLKGAPIRGEGRVIGALAVNLRSAVSDVALQSVAQLLGIGMERARVRRMTAMAEAARQNEQLKSTLLDAVAHEFKTPLTVIKASTTSMLAQAHLTATDAELTTIIDEEADHLTTLVNDAIELARMGSRAVSLKQETSTMTDIIRLAMDDVRTASEGHSIDLCAPDDLPSSPLDRKLMRLVIRQLLGNAFKYSDPDSPVTIQVTSENHEVITRVRNRGAEIPEREREMIFDKFYRGSQVRAHIPGAGMGLSISREIVEAHGGRLWLDEAPPHQVIFAFSVPAELKPVSARA